MTAWTESVAFIGDVPYKIINYLKVPFAFTLKLD
jgi:hypothetical protein